MLIRHVIDSCPYCLHIGCCARHTSAAGWCAVGRDHYKSLWVGFEKMAASDGALVCFDGLVDHAAHAPTTSFTSVAKKLFASPSPTHRKPAPGGSGNSGACVRASHYMGDVLLLLLLLLRLVCSTGGYRVSIVPVAVCDRRCCAGAARSQASTRSRSRVPH
jgi:hypothetical protein